MNFNQHDLVFCRTSLLLFAVIFASMTGCQPAKSAAQSQGQQADDHGHGRPAHKPYNLHAAVREVSRRGHDLLHLKSPEPTATAELLDIIRWLPEFAADTDLTRPHWEQVQEISKRLEVWAAPSPQGAASFQTPDHAMLDQSLTELRKIAALVPQPAGGESEPERTQHHHDHDHDDHDHRPSEKLDDSNSPAK